MQYATVADMTARFGERELIQLTDPDLQAVQTDRAERAIADAQAFADAFVGVAYRLPLAGCAKPAPVPGDPQAVELVPPPQLTRIVCDVARYYLYDDLAPESEVYRRFKQATAELQAIADGKAALMCPWGGEPGAPANGAIGGGDTYHDFAPRQIGRDVSGSYR